MRLSLLILVLALAWVAITDSFSLVNLLFGVVLAALATFILRQDFARPRVLIKAWKLARLTGLFIRELIVSAVRVAIVVLTPDLKSKLQPAVVGFPLTVKSDAEITMLASMITLTPGTLSVDVSDDRGTLYVHVLSMADRDALIAEIAGGFEGRISELFS